MLFRSVSAQFTPGDTLKYRISLKDKAATDYSLQKPEKYLSKKSIADDAECKEKADEIYETLQNMGIEVIYDDRKARPGAMFADADLLGVPVRVVVSPRNLAENVVEISTRDKSIDKQKTPVDQAVTEVQNIINKLTADINSKVNK